MFDLSSDVDMLKKMQYDRNKLIHERKESLRSDIGLIKKYFDLVDQYIKVKDHVDNKIFNNVVESFNRLIKSVFDSLKDLELLDSVIKENKRRHMDLFNHFSSTQDHTDPEISGRNEILSQMLHMDDSDIETEELKKELELLLETSRIKYSDLLVDTSVINMKK